MVRPSRSLDLSQTSEAPIIRKVTRPVEIVWDTDSVAEEVEFLSYHIC